jgi:hypothetical protein
MPAPVTGVEFELPEPAPDSGPERLGSPRGVRAWPVNFIEIADGPPMPRPKDPSWLKNPPDEAETLRSMASVKQVRIINDVERRAYLNEWGRGREVGRVPERVRGHPALRGVAWEPVPASVPKREVSARIGQLSLGMRCEFLRIQAQVARDADEEGKSRKVIALAARGNATVCNAETIPLLAQALRAEGVAYRLALVEILGRVSDRRACAELARLAVFDTSPMVRLRAVECLGRWPASEWSAALVAGLRHPWHLAAGNATRALVTLKARDTLPALLPLLNLPDPARPFPSPDDGRALVVREIVRLNHHHNCAVCHAAVDPFEGRPEEEPRDRLPLGSFVASVPTPGVAMKPFPSVEYFEPLPARGVRFFVRFDVTYLRPEFSVMLPNNPEKEWPAVQRYDFITRLRPATSAEADESRWKGSYPQRDAVLFALRELTGKDGGDSPAEWEQILLSLPREGREP